MPGVKFDVVVTCQLVRTESMLSQESQTKSSFTDFSVESQQETLLSAPQEHNSARSNDNNSTTTTADTISRNQAHGLAEDAVENCMHIENPATALARRGHQSPASSNVSKPISVTYNNQQRASQEFTLDRTHNFVEVMVRARLG